MSTTPAIATAAPPAAESPGGLSHAQIRTILFGLMAGMFLAALDQTIVSTSIRTIADQLKGLDVQVWVTTAYLITSTVTTPLYGKLSDIYGRRPLFLTAISLFVIGSLACSFASSMYQLAAFRAFQGLGAGGLFSLALAILADIVPPRERAKYQGYFLAVFGTSSVLGPLVGGTLAGASTILGITGWRWVFLINVPIGIIALAIVMRVLHIPHTRRDHRIDWWGATALIVGLVPLLIVAEQGQKWGWGSGRALGLIAVGVVGVVAFILIEIRMKEEALIPMRLFRNGTFSLGMAANATIGMALFGSILVLPLYLQLVKGASPTRSGLLLIPLTLGLMLGSILSGQLTSRTGRYKIFPVIGTAILAVFTFSLQILKYDTPLPLLMGFFVLIGLGLGLCMQTLLIAVQNVVPAKDIGVATSSATFFRQVGGTVGVAVFLSLLFNTLPGKTASALQSAQTDPAFQAAAAKAAGSQSPGVIGQYLGSLGKQLQIDSSFLQRIDPLVARPYQIGFSNSTHVVFLVVSIIALLGLGLVLMIKETPLRTMSAMQERQLDEASLQAETLSAGGDVGSGSGQIASSTSDAAGLRAETAQFDAADRAENGGSGNGSDPGSATGGAHSAAATDGQGVSVQELLRKHSDLVDSSANPSGAGERGRHQA